MPRNPNNPSGNSEKVPLHHSIPLVIGAGAVLWGGVHLAYKEFTEGPEAKAPQVTSVELTPAQYKGLNRDAAVHAVNLMDIVQQGGELKNDGKYGGFDVDEHSISQEGGNLVVTFRGDTDNSGLSGYEERTVFKGAPKDMSEAGVEDYLLAAPGMLRKSVSDTSFPIKYDMSLKVAADGSRLEVSTPHPDAADGPYESFYEQSPLEQAHSIAVGEIDR